MNSPPNPPMRGSSAEKWRRYAASLMRCASDAIRRAEEKAEDNVAAHIDATYRQMLNWLTTKVDQ